MGIELGNHQTRSHAPDRRCSAWRRRLDPSRAPASMGLPGMIARIVRPEMWRPAFRDSKARFSLPSPLSVPLKAGAPQEAQVAVLGDLVGPYDPFSLDELRGTAGPHVRGRDRRRQSAATTAVCGLRWLASRGCVGLAP